MLCVSLQAVSNEQSYEEYEMKSTAMLVIYGCLLNLICIMGIIGNLLSLWIMKTPEFSQSTTTIYIKVSPQTLHLPITKPPNYLYQSDSALIKRQL